MMPTGNSTTDLFMSHVRPRVAKLLALMKMDLVYHRASGENLYTYLESSPHKETEIKDFLGGYGTQFFGHHRQEIVEAMTKALHEQVPFQSQASVKAATAQAALELDRLLSEERSELGLNLPDHYVSTFTNSGAESVEAAIKLCLSQWGERKAKIAHRSLQKMASAIPAEGASMARAKLEEAGLIAQKMRPVFVALHRGFHGKTSGAVALTANREYSSMFERASVDVIFLDPGDLKNLSAAEAQLDLQLQKRFPSWRESFSQFGISPLAALIFEPLQAEGGIHPLDVATAKTLQDLSQRYGFPLIADEIQSGLMRCGHILYSHALGLTPDIVLLGKSLGGGIAKTGVMMARRQVYTDPFGFKHTSTFAEDEISAHVVLKVIEVLRRDKKSLAERAAVFAERVRKIGTHIQSQTPGILVDVRGAGFLMGFEFAADHPHYSFVVRALFESGFGAYFLSSFLLNQKQLRMGVTLSSPMTLRVEPSCEVSEEALVRLEEGLLDAARALDELRTGYLTSHLWKDIEGVAELKSRPIPRLQNLAKDKSRVCFLGHLVSERQVRNVDPLLKILSSRDMKKVIELSEVIELGSIIDEVLVSDIQGHEVYFQMYGFFNTSAYFEHHHREGSPLLLQRLQEVVTELENQGIEYIGLGQFTSIIGWNGLGIRTRPETKMTTGNSLTVATTIMSAEREIALQGKKMEDLTVGVVGVTGNIGSVVSEILMEKVKHLKLFYRDSAGASERFSKVLTRYQALEGGRYHHKITASPKLDDLRECDLIIVGTNATEPIIFSKHLKQGAVVVDISVPANVDANTLKERPDVVCFSGGLVQLPKDQHVIEWLSGLPSNEVFACLAETVMMALTKVETPYSYGPLTKASVERAMADFHKVGFSLGQKTYMSALL